jgi:hypothetical protein
MSPNVNPDRLKSMFPQVEIIKWDIETEEKPKNWIQALWQQAFGCGLFLFDFFLSWVLVFFGFE